MRPIDSLTRRNVNAEGDEHDEYAENDIRTQSSHDRVAHLLRQWVGQFGGRTPALTVFCSDIAWQKQKENNCILAASISPSLYQFPLAYINFP